MRTRQANILFIPTSIGGQRAERRSALSKNHYIQDLIYGSLFLSKSTIDGIDELGRQLAALARHAYLARDMDAVEQASLAMLALPKSKRLETVAQFYGALCDWRRGNVDAARRSLSRVAEEGSPEYRARALQIIASTFQELGDVDTALPIYLSARRAAANCDPLTVAESQRMTAVIRSIHGDHRQALADLENLFPLVRAIGRNYPVLYYDYLNSLAVELGEVGRVAEASAAVSISLASPFAIAYPEWSATNAEIADKRVSATPSIVSMSSAREAIPDAQPQPDPRPKVVRKSGWFGADATVVQRASIRIGATATIDHFGITQSILDRVLISTGPRAPPSRL